MRDARPTIKMEFTITGGTVELVHLMQQLMSALTIESSIPAEDVPDRAYPTPASQEPTGKPKRKLSPETLAKLRDNAAKARAAKFHPRMVEPMTGEDDSVVDTYTDRVFCWNPVEADFQQVRDWAIKHGICFETWDDDLPRVNRKRESLSLPIFKRKFR